MMRVERHKSSAKSRCCQKIIRKGNFWDDQCPEGSCFCMLKSDHLNACLCVHLYEHRVREAMRLYKEQQAAKKTTP